MAEPKITILPYSLIVGQEQLRLALELAYIAPAIGGVLISGHRGSGKSTAVRAFSQMIYGELPVTLPINATEDRVVGGWYIERLMTLNKDNREQSFDDAKQPGLLELANGKLLFIDEVNLLDDHIVNIILDVTATGVLVIQREERNEEKPISFTLVGTMNPEEGGLRPQLLDRFGLTVNVVSESNDDLRAKILKTVMDFDQAKRQEATGNTSEWLSNARQNDASHKPTLDQAKVGLDQVTFDDKMANLCVRIAQKFDVEGHRADYTMALAARAYAALHSQKSVTKEAVQIVAPMAIMHRRADVLSGGTKLWDYETDNETLEKLIYGTSD